MGYYEHGFEGTLSQIVYPDKYRYFVVRLPSEVANDMPFDRGPRVRVRGEINDLPLAGAFLPDGDATPYIILSGDLVRELGIALGDPVELRFDVEADDAVDMPSELSAALTEVDGAREAFDALSPGRQRGHAHQVRSAKQEATRRKRARKIANELLL